MAEYIEREATVLSLLDKGQHSRRYKLGEIWELDFEEIREAIKSIPAADVRPVVLCKDCWFFEKDTLFCSLHEADFAPDAFCSYATTDGQAEYWGMGKEDHDRKRREES